MVKTYGLTQEGLHNYVLNNSPLLYPFFCKKNLCFEIISADPGFIWRKYLSQTKRCAQLKIARGTQSSNFRLSSAAQVCTTIFKLTGERMRSTGTQWLYKELEHFHYGARLLPGLCMIASSAHHETFMLLCTQLKRPREHLSRSGP